MPGADPADALGGKRIGLLTASISRLGGGVARAVLAQARLVRGLGGEAVVFALADEADCGNDTRIDGISIELVRRTGPPILGYAPTLADTLLRSGADLLHLHGIWQYPSRAATLWTRYTGRPLVISPHGMLDPWITARGRWKKALARVGYERASWREAAAFHALTAAEAADIARETGRDDALVIPNPAPQAAREPRGDRPARLLYLGRIHSKKNLASLVSGWRLASAQGLPEGARLTIAGWGAEADVAELKSRIAGIRSIEFVGAVEGDRKQALLDEARFMVLPTHSEGLPMAILEAWAAGTPTLVSAHCNLPQGFAEGAAIDSGTDPAGIAEAIRSAFAADVGAWQAMSAAALRLAAGPFAQATIARRWATAYAGLLAHHGGAER